jgi:small subunit ribosomal protein S20
VANHSSAIKRNRQRIKRTTRNRSVKSALRTTVKKARAAIGTEQSAELTVKAQSDLDKAAKKRVIPKKRAARLKGRLAAALHKASQEPAPVSKAPASKAAKTTKKKG